jgi:hypothetical protein
MSKWEISLAQGEWFEDNVALPWLYANFPQWWITDCRLEKKSQFGGPKMRTANQVLTLPDFRLDNAETNQTIWIDAKYKTKSYKLDDYPGDYFTTIDPRSYQEYMDFTKVWPNSDFLILFGKRTTKLLYIMNLKTAKPVMHWYNNEHVTMGRNSVPCFSEQYLDPVGSWNPNLMPY